MTTSPTQTDIDVEIAAGHARFPRSTGPVLGFPAYRSSALRHPGQELVPVHADELELVSPTFGECDVDEADADLTTGHAGSPIGERMVVTGRVLDGTGRPLRRRLVEVWQANAAGRYAHRRDQHPAPLDPNFTGTGRCLTDDDGWYRFTTVKPGPYPWRNHHNAWRPAHIHFSFFGSSFAQRLVTQMYFPGDPLLRYDPILQSVTDPAARARLVADYDHDLSRHEWSTGYRWDVVLSGPSPFPSPTETS